MAWIQVSITATKDLAEKSENILLQLGALSITYKDAHDNPILEPDIGTTPIWKEAIITGLFDDSNETSILMNHIKEKLPASCKISIDGLQDQNWTQAWMENYKAMQFGDRLWVCPHHLEPPNPNAINLRLDPGLAFGTGTHPTTSLCLQWLDSNIDKQEQLLDYGCGTGILAIAGLLLGAKHADCVDIDNQAIEATFENAKTNKVEAMINTYTVEQFNQHNSNEKYDVVLANILSGPLIELAPTLQTLVKDGGDIVLSGILQEQAIETRTAYSNYFDLSETKIEGDWILLHGNKRA